MDKNTNVKFVLLNNKESIHKLFYKIPQIPFIDGSDNKNDMYVKQKIFDYNEQYFKKKYDVDTYKTKKYYGINICKNNDYDLYNSEL